MTTNDDNKNLSRTESRRIKGLSENGPPEMTTNDDTPTKNDDTMTTFRDDNGGRA
jgi:hypothetical protein